MTINVLFVDDESILVENISRFLESRGFCVFPYCDFEQAYMEINNGLSYDVAVVDLAVGGNLVIPGNIFEFTLKTVKDRSFSGYDVVSISKIKNPEAPVITISAYDINEVRHDLNSNHHFEKPYGRKALAETIERLVRKK